MTWNDAHWFVTCGQKGTRQSLLFPQANDLWKVVETCENDCEWWFASTIDHFQSTLLSLTTKHGTCEYMRSFDALAADWDSHEDKLWSTRRIVSDFWEGVIPGESNIMSLLLSDLAAELIVLSLLKCEGLFASNPTNSQSDQLTYRVVSASDIPSSLSRCECN